MTGVVGASVSVDHLICNVPEHHKLVCHFCCRLSWQCAFLIDHCCINAAKYSVWLQRCGHCSVVADDVNLFVCTSYILTAVFVLYTGGLRCKAAEKSR